MSGLVESGDSPQAAKSRQLLERVTRAEDSMRALIAERQQHREEAIRLQRERELLQDQVAQRLQHQAEELVQAERDRVARELSAATRYEKDLLGKEQRSIAADERERLYREQQAFLQREAERLAAEEAAFRREEARRLKAEKEAHDALTRTQAVEDIATIERRERERLAQDASSAAMRVAGGVDRDRWLRDIEQRRADLRRRERELTESHERGTAAAGAAAPTAGSASAPATSAAAARKLVLIMTVDIGDGRSESIHVYSDSDPRELAAQFAAQHGLGDVVVEPLAENIRQNVAQLSAQASARTPRPASAASTPRSPNRSLSPSVVQRLGSEVPKMMEEKRRMSRSQPVPGLTLTPRIDERSRRLAEKGRTGKVYDRLHQQAELHKKKVQVLQEQLEKQKVADVERTKTGLSQYSKVIMKTRNSGEYPNYGARLYAEGLQSREKREGEAERLRREKEKEEAELTFRPQISTAARKLKRPATAPWERMLSHAEEHKAQLEQMRRQLEEKEVESCTFRPQISEHTRKLIAERSKHSQHMPAHEALYLDAERRRMRMEEYQNWFPEDHTFKPDIGDAKVRAPLDHNTEEFLNRLVRSKQEHDRALEEQKRQLERSLDPETGQPLFKPQTGRPPNFPRNPHDLPVYEYLFLSRHEFEDIRGAMRARFEQELKAMAEQRKVQPASEKLLQQARQRHLRQLFDAWDTDADGLISVSDIDPHRVGDEMGREVLAMVKDESAAAALTFSEFLHAVDEKLKQVAAGPSAHVFAVDREADRSVSSKDEAPPFKPTLNPTSVALAARRRTTDKPVYETLNEEAAERERRSLQRTAEAKAAELSKCTFRPQVGTGVDKLEPAQVEELTRRLTTPVPRSHSVSPTASH